MILEFSAEDVGVTIEVATERFNAPDMVSMEQVIEDQANEIVHANFFWSQVDNGGIIALRLNGVLKTPNWQFTPGTRWRPMLRSIFTKIGTVHHWAVLQFVEAPRSAFGDDTLRNIVMSGDMARAQQFVNQL